MDKISWDHVQDSIRALANPFHFFVIGDWGRAGLYWQREVAHAMERVAMEFEPAFVISTGDNFYPDGVADIYDLQWRNSFNSIYNPTTLPYPWYAVLGNHDIHLHAQAQIDFTEHDSRWNMPDKYYSFSMERDNVRFKFIMLDTSPFESEYYQPEYLIPYVFEQDREAQLEWLENELKNNSADWTIVTGHHPLYTGGWRADQYPSVRIQLEPLLAKYKVDMFLAGHEHDLQFIKSTTGMYQLVSGAGSDIRDTGYLPQSLFAAAIAGFSLVSCSRESLDVFFFDFEANPIFQHRITKDITRFRQIA